MKRLAAVILLGAAIGGGFQLLPAFSQDPRVANPPLPGSAAQALPNQPLQTPNIAPGLYSPPIGPSSFGTSPGSAAAASAGNLALSVQQFSGNRTQLIVLDAERRSLACYHVDEAGILTLKSMRSINADLQMEHFNGTPPLPKEVRQVTPQ